MLFKIDQLKGIKSGDITVAFRCWKRPTVKVGGTLRTPVGVLAIESVDRITRKTISTGDVKRAGFESRDDLLKRLGSRENANLYRIAFRLVGDDPRTSLRKRSALTKNEMAELSDRLARYDRAGRQGPWTRRVLKLIADHPATRAADLAERIECDKTWLKVNVRKLKDLGLTESLEVGYRLSPRGRAFMRRSADD